MRRPSGTCEMPSATSGPARCAGDVAAVEADPRRRAGREQPATARSSVDLPAPFAPISVTISPGCTSSETPCSAWIAP